MSDDVQREFREVQAFFRLPSVGLVEKDLHVVRAIAAIAAIDATPFTLIFGGGTALARAHKLVRRMSEDVDFKIVPKPAAPISRNGLRRALGALRERVTDALLATGFAFDSKDKNVSWSRDDNHYTVWHLPYDGADRVDGELRATIKIELNYAPLRLRPVTLPVSSFVTEARGLAPDVAGIGCVSLNETAAEKLVGLTRRTAMDLAGLTRGPTDPTLVRHIYDLHAMRDLVDAAIVASLAADIAAADAVEFRNQYPAYYANTDGETRKALDALQSDVVHHQRYDSFLSAMVYGEKPKFEKAFGTVLVLVEEMCRQKKA